LDATDGERKLSSNELEEIRRKPYENTQLRKERANILHSKHINRKEFSSGKKVLLYGYRLHLFPRKLWSR